MAEAANVQIDPPPMVALMTDSAAPGATVTEPCMVRSLRQVVPLRTLMFATTVPVTVLVQVLVAGTSVATNTHAAPTLPLSRGPPIRAVFPSADRAALWPNRPLPISPLPVSLRPCCVQTPPERVNTQAAPTLPLSPGPPIRAVFPSADNATLLPNSPVPVSPLPVSLAPCCVQPPPERVNTHAAPTWLLSMKPPTRAVFPSADNATPTAK